MADAHKNFAYSLVATAPSPAGSGTSLVVTAGQGALFPAVPFNATIWPAGTQPTSTNAEIVRVTNISTDTFTITRQQEGTAARTVVVGDQIAATITAKTLTDIDTVYVNTYSPYVPTSGGTGVQTLQTNYTNASVTLGNLVLFPMTLTGAVRFNQVLVPMSLSYVTSTNAATNTYYSHYGIYSMTGGSQLSLITSYSFSIVESESGASLTWNYPTSTATSGWGYGTSFPNGVGNLTATGQMSSYISGTRVVGLHFATEMSLSGGNYWMGLLARRSTANANSTYGLSNVGIIGQIMNPINQGGTVSGLMPIGKAPAEWSQINVSSSGWNGRYIAAALNTSVPYFGGTVVPNYVYLSHMSNPAASFTVTILPTVTFVST